MKEEALKLADEMIDVTDCETSEFYRAGQMIRRLVEELDKQGEPDYFILTQDRTWLSCDEDFYNKAKPTHRMKCYTTPQTKPLSFDVMVELGKEVDAVWDVNINGSVLFPSVDAFESFCRAIEERHGIK